MSSAVKHPTKFDLTQSVWVLLLVCLMVRVYLLLRAPFVSPDAYLYIQQAKALYYGLNEQILNCYFYISPYPLVVSSIYPIFDDWVTAAQCVNILFSTLSVIPMCWLLRLFFDKNITFLTALIFILLPSYAWVAIDGLRDPIFWLFSLWGLFFYLSYQENNRGWFLSCCSLFLILATWARIEAALFVLVTISHFLITRKQNKWKMLLIHLAPIFIIFILIGIYAVWNGISLDDIGFLNYRKLFIFPKKVISNYFHLRDALEMLDRSKIAGVDIYFFDRIRSLVWVIAFVALIIHITESLLYLPVIVIVVGIWSSAKRLNDSKIKYIVYLTTMALLLLYISTIYSWHAAPRHLAVLLLPCFVYIGEGMKRIQIYLRNLFKKSDNQIRLVFMAIIILLFIPKIIIANFDQDKLTYKEIGKDINIKSKDIYEVKVCGAIPIVKNISFYANVNKRNASCFDKGSIVESENLALGTEIVKIRCDYFISQGSKTDNLTNLTDIKTGRFRLEKVQEYETKKHGPLILYTVMYE